MGTPLKLPDGQAAGRFVTLASCAALPEPAPEAAPPPAIPDDTAAGKPGGMSDKDAGRTDDRPDPGNRAPVRIVPERAERPSLQLSHALGHLSRLAAADAGAGPELLALAPRSYRTGFDREIAEAARRHRVDPLLLHAIIRQESSYRSAARSPVGALGLMQIMPATGASLGTPRSALFDPASNIDTGARLLRRLNARYRGDLDLVLAAYNAGEGAVARYGNRVPPFRETRDYIRKVKADYVRLAGENGLTGLLI